MATDERSSYMIIGIRLLAHVALIMLAIAPNPPWRGLPTRTLTGSGIVGDPVNVGFEGSQAQILAAFRAIGWVEADPLSLKSDARLAVDAVTHRLYPSAPVSKLFLFRRAEDFAVEHELGSVARRDHARFWDTGRKDPATGLEIWIGDAARDIGIEVLRKHGIPVGATHKIDPNLDGERSLIVNDLKSAGSVTAVIMEPGMGAVKNAVNGGGDHFGTDGKVALIILRA
jgi:hypothetical protein